MLNELLLPVLKDFYIGLVDGDSGDLGSVREDPDQIERPPISDLHRGMQL
jgi:hypothetical protein